MKQMPETGNGDILLTMMHYAKTNQETLLNGEKPSRYASDRLIGRCPRDMAQTIRDLLRERHGVKVKLRPRGPSPITTTIPSGSFNVRKSEALKYYDDCAIYVIGCTASRVFKMAEKRAHEDSANFKAVSVEELAKHSNHPIAIAVSVKAGAAAIRCSKCNKTLVARTENNNQIDSPTEEQILKTLYSVTENWNEMEQKLIAKSSSD
jgi:hypothetical protein